jgi:hypothetical protein
MGKNINIYLKEFKIKKILNWLLDLDFMAEDRDKWSAVVDMVMNCLVHKVIGISLLAEKLSACQ